jgi:hypothetical protein
LFPTGIRLATDGSEDAQRAANTVAALSRKLESELHVEQAERMRAEGGKSSGVTPPVRVARCGDRVADGA